MEQFRKKDYDLAVIGACMNQNLKFHDRPEGPDIICYQPSVYHDLKRLAHGHDGVEDHRKVTDNFMDVYRTIKNEPVGTPVGKEGGGFTGYNNKYWTYRTHPGFDIIKRKIISFFATAGFSLNI